MSAAGPKFVNECRVAERRRAMHACLHEQLALTHLMRTLQHELQRKLLLRGAPATVYHETCMGAGRTCNSLRMSV